ncbi:MAG: UDP-N-acetylmuramoyl-L-alanyl-D-glutamate--2,6-diaminopimelate ligase [Thermodesulfobacteriota bacterium]
MKLEILIDAIADKPTPAGWAETAVSDITGIYFRSDQVRPGGVFVALTGHFADGHDYIADAVDRGAAAVVVDRPVSAGVPAIEVVDTRRAMAEMAAAFYGRPSERITLIGITGTNGKTTVAYLLESILKQQGVKTGVIGTVNYHYGAKTFPGGLTTPEAPDLQRVLSEMADAGVTHVIMEVSSHGVVLDRVRECRFDVGVFTNLSQDHLDFHGDMEAYWAAKQRFFTDCLHCRPPQKPAAVINCHDEKGRALARQLEGAAVLTVGSDENCRVRASAPGFDETGISGRMHLPDAEFLFHSPLVGPFNLENILCAAGAAAALHVAPETIRAGIESFDSVPGRLEPVANNARRHVFVDFSHTPAALENVLTALRAIVPGRLICIFGCGGDRDRGKRPQMGEIAARHADLVIVTSDNPRTEAKQQIIDDIVAGVGEITTRRIDPAAIDTHFVSGSFVVDADRAGAIDCGIRVSAAGDAVLIAGKGHETYQILGRQTIAFDDRAAAQKALAAYGMIKNGTDSMDN